MGIEVRSEDWNISLSSDFGATVSEEDARQACTRKELDSLNRLYFQAQDALQGALQREGASWEPQLGYADVQYDSASPAAVCRALTSEGPLDEALRKRASVLLSDGVPDVVGISITVPGQILPGLYSARALRQCGYTGRIVLGGNVVTRLGLKMALPWVFRWVDALALWQGELTLPVLCQSAAARDLSQIPNLIWMDEHGIRVNEERQLSRAQFTAPDFSGLPLGNYWGTPYLTAIGSRGCYYGRCTFCSIPYAWGKGGFLGHETPAAVVNQIQTGIERHGCSRFKFVDEALHPVLMANAADALVDHGLNVEFEGYARLDPSWLAAGVLPRLAKGGLKKLYLGLELAPSNTRFVLNKSDRAEPREFLAALADNGILAHTFCLFGYPGTGVDEAISTIDFALKNAHLIDTLDVFPYYYATHTEVPRIRAVDEPDREWALERKYLPDGEGVLAMEEVSELCTELEGYLWRSKPHWLHPVYRMTSPWTATPLTQ